MQRVFCRTDSYTAEMHDCCDMISLDDCYPFPNGEQKVGCLIDIIANPIVILYQRDISIYCPIFI